MDAPNLELELSRLIQSGDRRRAATVIVERFASDVYALCRAMVRDATLAEDLSQDAFGRAIAALETFRGESSARTWVLKIARNRCLDHLRAQKRAPIDGGEHDVDAHATDASPVLDVLVDREDAQRALGSLGETDRAIVVLHFGHGVGYAELAEAFSLKEGAVRMRVSRAVARMREEIATDGLASPMLGAPAAAVAPPARKSGGGLLDRFLRRREAPAGPARGGPPPAPGAPPAPAMPRAPDVPAPATPAPQSAPVPPRAAARPTSAAGGVPPGAPPAAGGPPPSLQRARGASPLHGPLHDDAPPTLLARLRALVSAA